MFDANSFNNSQFWAIFGGMSLITMVLIGWSLIWKGIALWYAARRGEKVWYVLLLVLNTMGILEIIYIFAVAKRTDKVVHTTPIPPTPNN